MADILDQTDEDTLELGEGEELGNLEELGVEETPDTSEEEAISDEQIDGEQVEEEPQFDVPAKFKDKSVEDVIKSYTELEKEFGRRNNEIGELRKLTDDILRSSLKINGGEEQSASATREKVDIDTLLNDPDSAIDKAINESPRLKQLEEQLKLAKIEEKKQAFEAKYPDVYDLVQDSNFQQWIHQSSVRQSMLQDAHVNYNYDVASELIDWYKQATGTKVEEAKEKRKQKAQTDLKAATVEKGTTGQSSKKIFRRADILKLMRTNPEKYNSDAFQAQLVKAYEEGRVR